MKTTLSPAMAMQLPHEEDDELSCQKGIPLDELSFTDAIYERFCARHNSSNLRIEKKSFEYLNKKYLSDLDLGGEGISSAKIYILDELKKSILLFSISIFLGLRVVFWLGDVGVGEIFFSMLTYGLLAVVFFKSLNTNDSI